jgi:transcriptional regulator GlxA family with amidase domain
MDQRIQSVIALMEDNINRRLSLSTLAECAGLSSSRLRHKFKAEIGMTPTTYLQTRRLQMARQLLSGSRLTVKEVRVAIGISSDSLFTYQFKRTYGMPPSRSRRA